MKKIQLNSIEIREFRRFENIFKHMAHVPSRKLFAQYAGVQILSFCSNNKLFMSDLTFY